VEEVRVDGAIWISCRFNQEKYMNGRYCSKYGKDDGVWLMDVIRSNQKYAFKILDCYDLLAFVLWEEKRETWFVLVVW
jgi:hypothetical protein